MRRPTFLPSSLDLIWRQTILSLKVKLTDFIQGVQQGVQNWIRQEIVDDDPHDEKAFFPTVNQPDKSIAESPSTPHLLPPATPLERR